MIVFIKIVNFFLLAYFRSDATETKKSGIKNENAVKYGELIILG